MSEIAAMAVGIHMGLAEKVEVRFARTDYLAWCIAEDGLVDEAIISRKIELKEIVVAEVERQIVGYLRLDYL